MAKKPSLGKTAQAILEALKAHPQGLTISEIRQIVCPDDPQQHLDRRVRELDRIYVIKRTQRGRETVYTLKEERTVPWDYAEISKSQRAKALHRAHGRCQMCGRTIEKDRIRLHVDHKIPRQWGGETADENLWAICSDCNEGKKNYFASFDPAELRAVLAHDSVHRRIAELLRLKLTEWVDSSLIEFVAGIKGAQHDWPKRTRELRYFNLVIKTRRRKAGHRSVTEYRLLNWVELPADPTKAAREYERNRADKNRRKRGNNGQDQH